MVSFEEVQAAARQIAGVAHRTPVMTSRLLDAACGNQIFLKCENLQRVGAFKFRGATNAISRLSAAEKAAGVITHSSGNHAQAVALVSQLLGVKATIVMPNNAPALKLNATRDYGATVVLYDPATDVREAISQELAQRHGYVLIPPYNHPHIVAGQGTAGLELGHRRGTRGRRRRDALFLQRRAADQPQSADHRGRRAHRQPGRSDLCHDSALRG